MLGHFWCVVTLYVFVCSHTWLWTDFIFVSIQYAQSGFV